MKRRSILPSVFDRCGFSHYTVAQLLSRVGPWSLKTTQERDFRNITIHESARAVLFEDWLPELRIPKVEGTDTTGSPVRMRGCSIKLDASYMECSDDTWSQLDERDQNSEATCLNLLSLQSLTTGNQQLFSTDSFEQLIDFVNGVAFEGAHSTQLNERNRLVTIDSRIFLSQPDLYSLDDLQSLLRRKAYVAAELTTSYRRMMTLVEAIVLSYKMRQPLTKELLQSKGFPSVVEDLLEIISSSPVPGSTGAKSLHATREDTWRLLGNFGKINEVIHDELSLKFQDFHEQIAFLVGFPSVCGLYVDDYLDYWESKHFTPREVIFKKTLEFFIHERISKTS